MCDRMLKSFKTTNRISRMANIQIHQREIHQRIAFDSPNAYVYSDSRGTARDFNGNYTL